MGDAHEWEVAVELAWQKYIDACDDITVPYSKVVEYRTVYDRILNDCPCECSVCKT